MIQANELMIGNWVSVFEENIQLTQINDEFVEYAPISPRINPISLTPEILESCGFKSYYNKNNSGSVIYTVGDFDCEILESMQDLKTNEIEYRLKDCPVLVYIKYVHQLQNWYFLLFGAELKINFNVESIQ